MVIPTYTTDARMSGEFDGMVRERNSYSYGPYVFSAHAVGPVPEFHLTSAVTTTLTTVTSTSTSTTTTTSTTSTTTSITTDEITSIPTVESTTVEEVFMAEIEDAVDETVEEAEVAYDDSVVCEPYVSDADYVLLCNAVGHEYGSDFVSVYDKALVVEVIMNRVNSSAYPDTILGVLTAPYQFTGAESYAYLGTYSYQVTDSVKAAVDYYFNNPGEFNHGYLSFWGDGTYNHFN